MRHRVATVIVIAALGASLAVAPSLVATAAWSATPRVIVPTPEPTLPEEPEPTEPPNPVPTETSIPTPPPVDPGPAPTEVPEEPQVPIEVPAEPEVPAEVPVEEEPSFVDEDDSDFEEGEVAPIAPIPSETPTPTPTPVPAVDIFAPFYPPSSGAARDLLPLTLGGIAAGLVVLTAIVAFVVSRWKLARLRSSIIAADHPGESSSHADRRLPHKTPSALDISSLVGTRARSRKWSAPSFSIDLPDRPEGGDPAQRARRYGLPAGLVKPAPERFRPRLDVSGVLGQLARAQRTSRSTASTEGLEAALGRRRDRGELPALDLDWSSGARPVRNVASLKLDFPPTP